LIVVKGLEVALYVWAPLLTGLTLIAISQGQEWEAAEIAISGLSVGLALAAMR